MSRLSGTVGGAASGAATGAALGPWGAAAGGVIGGVLGYFGSGDDDAAKEAQRAKEAADQKAADQYLSWRDSVNDAHMKAVQGQESFFDMNSSMANSMNGGQGSPDIAGHAYTSPIHAEGMKAPTTYEATSQQYGNQPMPEGNAPKPLTFVPGGR